MASADDSVIFERAASEDRVVVAADTDLGTLLAQRGTKKPSVILFRGVTNRQPANQVEILLANLPAIEQDLLAGAVIAIEPTRLRIRRLPIMP